MKNFTIDLENDCILIGEESVQELENIAPAGVHDTITATGFVSAKLFDADGNIKQEFEFPNLVTTVGRNWLAKRLADEASNNMTHMAVGTSGTAPVIGNTTLIGTELGRVAFTSKVRAGAAVTIVGNFPAGTATGTLQEAGIFDGSSGTELLCRVTFGSVIKAALDAFQITWTITMS